ncbi:hypothetical protein RR21198_3148 [Rhodococcus rhodochrous ATCC 21198]|uniref:hypothetical protein n=1 Tax=Rhodococcus aetherivorans TaxID=191292 RepID=UPI0003E2A2D0|nr:hypothetical protein [Rhodococcus aetherivorans]ETT26270.1 hypothetical protein RR21198_3148 [Rhodococcus rhodochrous ATCC 21198]NGP25867.1 hypothetical protein [Rhodococcus aetherivorans]
MSLYARAPQGIPSDGDAGAATDQSDVQRLADAQAEIAKLRERNRELVGRNDVLVQQVRDWADENGRLARRLDTALRTDAARRRVLDTWCADPVRPYLPAIHLITALETAL